MTQREFHDLLSRYRNIQSSPEEMAYIEECLSAIIAEGRNQPIDDQELDALEEKLWTSLQLRTTKQRHLRKGAWIKIAASLLIGSFAFLFINRLTDPQHNHIASQRYWKTFRNHQAAPASVVLSDSSTVLVFPQSEISYPDTFTITREVSLTGKAFFQIKKDALHPFLVYTGELTTKVLGTSFTIAAYKKQKNITVSVRTGRVSVSSETPFYQLHKREVILLPNQQAVYDTEHRKTIKALVDVPRVMINPTSKTLSYNEEQAFRVLDDLSRMYGIEIQYDKKILDRCTITTEMSNESLYQRLDIITHVINASYTIHDGMIVITSQGCFDQ